MITQSDILEYVKYQPDLIKESFFSLIKNESSATQNTLIAIFDRIREILNRSGQVVIVATKNWGGDFFSNTELTVADLIDIVTKESEKEKATLRFKIKKFFLGDIMYKAIGYVLDLDLANLSQKQRLLVGDAIFLAAIYKGIE